MAIRDRIVGAGRSALRAADSYLASVSPDTGDSPVLDVDLDEPLVRGETGNTTSGSGDATPIKNGSKPAQFELPSPTSDDPRALYWDPFSVVEQLGYKDKPTAMTYNTLRTIMWRVPIIRAIIQTRVNQVAAFAIPQRNRFDPGFRVKLRDPAQRATRAARKFESELEAMIMQSGVRSDARYRDNFEQFLRKFVLDSLSLDQACAEILYGRNGKPAEWYAVDAATIRLADMRKLSPDLDPAAIKTVQVYDNVIINEFRADEMMFCIRNPRTDTRSYGYGTSEIEMLMSTVTSILYAWNYNQNFFQQGSVAKGFLNIRGNMPERQLKQFRRQWYQQLASVANAWRTPILSAEKGVDWHNMQSCLAGDTLIWTADRGAVGVAEYLAGASRKQARVWTGVRWSDADVFKTDEPKILCHTTLRDGTVIDSSPDHRFRVVDEAGRLAWRAQCELQVGDYVLLNKKSYETGTVLRLPSGQAMGEDLAEVLGWATGDGSFDFGGSGSGGLNRVRLFYHPKHEGAILERHLAVLESYGVPARRDTYRITDERAARIRETCGWKNVEQVYPFIRIDSVKFAEWLQSLGVTSSHLGKKIPAALFMAAPPIRAAFLRGLFSADGANHAKRNPILSARQASIRRGVRDLLHTLGIRCCAGQGKFVTHPTTKVVTEGQSYLKVKDRDRFFACVGFVPEQEHKQPSPVPTRNGLSDTVPPSVFLPVCAAIRDADKRAGRTLLSCGERKILCELQGGRSGCSLQRLRTFADKAGVPLPNWLDEYNLEPVVGLENTGILVDMYDLTLHDDAHQFVANGIITHNSNRDMEFSAWMDFLIKVACFAPETKVVMGDGTHKEICAVAPGDLVRTHAGRVRAVKNVQTKRHVGDMIRIRASGREVLATPEHPFEIVASRIDGHMRREFDDPRFERADAIVPGNDFLVVPKPKPLPETCTRIDLGAYVDPEVDNVLETTIKPKANRSTEIPRFIELTDANAFALGLYLAEGCGCRSRSGVSFSFHRDETEYVAAAQTFFGQFGLASSVVDLAPKLGVQVLAHSISLARAVHNLFGDKALNKRIPMEILNGPMSARRAFVSGFLAGDGCVWESKIRDSRTMTANLVSTSAAAAEAVQGMLLEQGIYAGRYRSGTSSRRSSPLWQVVVGGVELKKLSGWLTGPKGDKLRALLAERDGQTRRAVYETVTRFYVPVAEVSREPYDGMVFNLEVEEDHTYQVENFSVHNCSVFAMDPIEVNFKYGSSNARSMFDTGNKSKTTESKDRGLRPLLRFISRELDRYIVHPIDEDFTLEFVGLDSSTPKELADLNTQRVRSMFTIDEIRIENDLPPLPEGSGEVILDSNWLAYRRELLAREQQKRQQAEAVAAAAASATSLTDAALGGGMPGAQVVPGSGAVIDTPPQQAGATAIAAKPAASGHAPGAIPGRGGGAGESAEPQGPDKDQIAELEGLLNPSHTSSMTKSTSETIEIIDL